MMELAYIRHRPIPYKWDRGDLPERVYQRLDEIFKSWENTPYVPNQRKKGQAVDCVRFFVAVYDELYGREFTPCLNLPQDIQAHNKMGALKSIKFLKTMFPNSRLIRPNGLNKLTPGDVIVSGPTDGGPGHTMIVGTQPNTYWEAADPRVRKAGWSYPSNCMRIFGAYTMGDKDQWV